MEIKERKLLTRIITYSFIVSIITGMLLMLFTSYLAPGAFAFCIPLIILFIDGDELLTISLKEYQVVKVTSNDDLDRHPLEYKIKQKVFYGLTNKEEWRTIKIMRPSEGFDAEKEAKKYVDTQFKTKEELEPTEEIIYKKP